jgi:hypothetical protein
MDNNPKQQVIDRLKQANNVLVTVSNNPSVDQLAACIGLALMLNKMGKHGTAVFSGEVPSTIEFLQPEKTIEKNTDSLRDFIIALDKSKADKLRYKVEDRVVKIFITPYRTTLTQADLEFSQGDFNVDVVIGLGVHQQTELDQAITAHGRILHDATVVSINISPNGDIGNINWVDIAVSSLCELIVQLGEELGQNIFDKQIATALLTGIVAATDRFSNSKTSPQTMSASAKLIEAGANPQLVATQLEEKPVESVSLPTSQPAPAPASESHVNNPPAPPPADEGTLAVDHGEPTPAPPPAPPSAPVPEPNISEINIDPEGKVHNSQQAIGPPPADASNNNGDIQSMIPSDNNQLTSASGAPAFTSTTSAMDDLFASSALDTMSTSAPITPPPPAAPQLSLPPIEETPPPPSQPLVAQVAEETPTAAAKPEESIEKLEEVVNSPHLSQAPAPTPPVGTTTPTSPSDSNQLNIEAARNAVKAAVNSQPGQNLEPIQALNAQTAFDNIQGEQPLTLPAPTPDNNPLPSVGPARSLSLPDNAANYPENPLQPMDMPQPTMNYQQTSTPSVEPSNSGYLGQPVNSVTAPPVPPPMTFMPPGSDPNADIPL